MEEKYLIHWGILGMHWGIRRYQNPDGSLTEAGKARYYNTDGSLTNEGRKWEADKRKKMAKHPELMTSEELDSYINRMTKEMKVRELLEKSPNRKLTKQEKKKEALNKQIEILALETKVKDLKDQKKGKVKDKNGDENLVSMLWKATKKSAANYVEKNLANKLVEKYENKHDIVKSLKKKGDIAEAENRILKAEQAKLDKLKELEKNKNGSANEPSSNDKPENTKENKKDRIEPVKKPESEKPKENEKNRTEPVKKQEPEKPKENKQEKSEPVKKTESEKPKEQKQDKTKTEKKTEEKKTPNKSKKSELNDDFEKIKKLFSDDPSLQKYMTSNQINFGVLNQQQKKLKKVKHSDSDSLILVHSSVKENRVRIRKG